MSIGLKPVIRRIWACKGHRPVIRVQQRYEWLYVYGFVHPESGASQWLLLPSVNVEVFSIALAHFAQATGAGSDRRIALVLDRAGWHESSEVVVPEGIHLVFLPPTRQNCSLVNTSGPSRRLLPTVASSPLTRCKRHKPSDVSPYTVMRLVSAAPRSSTGGLSVLVDMRSSRGSTSPLLTTRKVTRPLGG